MAIRSHIIGRTFRNQGLSRSNRAVCFKWVYPSVLLLSFVMFRRIVNFHSPYLLTSQLSLTKLNTCANISDPLKFERDSKLMMNVSENCTAAQDYHELFLHIVPHDNQRYMWYAPHDGFDKQVLQLVNALKIAMLLNRTLIVPPIFEEGEVVLGNCYESQITPTTLRQLAWSAVAERVADSRYSYVSIADIIDLRTVSPKWVRTIDMRVFLALWCGIDVSSACGSEGEFCHNFTSCINPSRGLESCRTRFFPPKLSCLVREVDESCKTTIWTNSEDRASRELIEQRLNEELLEQYGLIQDSSASSTDQYHSIKRKSVVESLGAGTAADRYTLLSFGSLMSQPLGELSLLADIRPTAGNDRMEQALETMEALPYTEEIMRGTSYILELFQLSSRPFFCAHLDVGTVRRNEDRDEEEVMAEVERILTGFRSRLEKLVEEERRNGSGERRRVNVFVMTGFSSETWNEKYLGDIADNRTFYEIHTIDGYDDVLMDTAHRTMTQEYGVKVGYIPRHLPVVMNDVQHSHAHSDSGSRKVDLPPDIRACVEEVVCSCASLGFYGTFPSAVSSRIVNLRRSQSCPTFTSSNAADYTV